MGTIGEIRTRGKWLIALAAFGIVTGMTMGSLKSAFAGGDCGDKSDCLATYTTGNCNWCASTALGCGVKITAVGGGFELLEDPDDGYADWEISGTQHCYTVKYCTTTTIVPCVHNPHQPNDKVCVETGLPIVVNGWEEGMFADEC